MTASWCWIMILDGQLMWIICIIIYRSDYVEKMDDTFTYAPHPIPKPIQQQILLLLNINRHSHDILIKI